MQHQPHASSAVGNSDALLRATAGSSGLSRRAVLRFGALFSAGLALSACSGQSSAGSAAGSSASASASSADARRVFRFAQGAAPLGLDPALFPVASTYQVTAQVLQTLLVANHYTGDPEVQDSLCSEWTVSDDRLVHTFVLREAHFSNGSALTADAVVQNFQRWQALATGEGTVALAVPAQPLFAWGFGVPKPGSIDPSAVEPAPVQASPSGAATPSASASETATPSASASASASDAAHPGEKKGAQKSDSAQSSVVQSFLPLVSSVVAKGNSVVVTLSRPSLAFPRILTQQAFGIIEPSLFGADQKLTGHPVGTGAFRVESFKDGTVRLLKNTHFEGQAPELDEIQISTLTSSDKRYFALMEGHIDACDQVNSTDLGQLARDGYQTPGRDPFSLVFLGLNTAHPVLKNISVRRAISHAVDRGALRQYYPQGTSDAQTLISPSFRIKADDAKNYTERNQDMARSLLAAAGYDNQVIECYYPADVSLPWMDTPQKVYSEMVASLIEVGLNIKPVPLPWAEYLPKSREVSSERGITLAGFYGMYRDPYAFFGPVLAPLIAEHQVRSLIADAPSDMTTGLTKKNSDVPSSRGAGSNVRISASPSPQPSYSPDPLSPEEEASASASPSPSVTPSPLPTAAAVAPSPRFTEVMEAIRTADSADSVDSQRELYAKVLSQLGQFMPAVPLLNMTSKVAVSREVQGYQTEQNAIELFGKLRKL
ncbi:ABC transporter substrate-binding protein [Rothia mucilaginosa]|uniref:ABC transporter substrate-binding protein n=1 Tax=Rothia mucilaginosa TaxID=43675 RepID=UPI0028E3AA68|nr:ABC transporter substrate-binding protein [Rothia mucilaginosa]